MRFKLATFLLISGLILPIMVGAQTLRDIQMRLDNVMEKVENLQVTTPQTSPVKPAIVIPDVCNWTPGTLQQGSRDGEEQDVSKLQIHLRDLGYFSYPEITGYFGPITKASLEQFQLVEDIAFVDGILPGILDADTAEYLMLRSCANFVGETNELSQKIKVGDPLANVYYNYKDGNYTVVGQSILPSACHLLNVTAEVRESFPEQVVLRFDDRSTLSNARCAPVETVRPFSIQVTVSEKATFSATYNDAPIIFSFPGENQNEQEVSKVQIEDIEPGSVSLDGDLVIIGSNLEDVAYVSLKNDYYLKKYKFPYLRKILSKKELKIPNLKTLYPLNCSAEKCESLDVNPGTYNLFAVDFDGRPSNSLQIIITE